MSRHVQLRMFSHNGSTVLYGLVMPNRTSPKKFKAFIGGLPFGDVAFSHMQQVRSNGNIFAIKFNRFNSPQTILGLLKAANLKISGTDVALLEEYTRGNSGAVLSPTSFTDETVTFLHSLTCDGEFSGIPLRVIGHSIGASTIALRLTQLSSSGVIDAIHASGGGITMLAPMVIHPTIQEKSETPFVYTFEFEQIRKRALFASVSDGSVKDLKQEFRNFWNRTKEIPNLGVNISVVITDNDKESAVGSKIALVQKLRELGFNARLVLLSFNGGEFDIPVPFEKITAPRKILDDAVKAVSHGRPIRVLVHECYPFLLSKVGKSELI